MLLSTSLRIRFCALLALTTGLLSVTHTTQADIRLPLLISDGAVLQRDKPIHIWGWADEGEKISGLFDGETLTTTAKEGRWSLTFAPRKAGGPYALTLNGKNSITLKDLWLGDVWIGAGQSNMEFPLNRVRFRYPDLIGTTQLPKIREFNVPVTFRFDAPAEDFEKGQWKTATPDNLGNFSAVGFFFARHLQEQYQVPVGIISLSVGGSPVEAWMSEESLVDYPEYLAKQEALKDPAVLEATRSGDQARAQSWYTLASKSDKGRNSDPQWSAAELPLDGWQTYKVPGYFKEQGIDFENGVAWVRKEFELTAEQAAKPAELWLGVLIDGDETFVNGQQVGQVGYRYPPRVYTLPAGLLKAGKNTVAVRLTSYSGSPGFIPDKTYALKLGEDQSEQIDLSGDWHYRIGMVAGPMPPSTTLHYQPTTLYKAKLAPVLNTPITGVIWYQGESNITRAKEYFDLFPRMIRDWRKQFGQGDFPFLYVQLANLNEAHEQPVESDMALLREAQRYALSEPNTAMAVALDVGEWNDIHPLDKQSVGDRLALGARKLAYGDKKVVASGPLVKSVQRRGSELIIEFTDTAKGLEIRGDQLYEIAIAGEDKQFVWAKAKLDGKHRLRLSSPEVKTPVWVRYAWADNPSKANLYNSAGLPASSFEAQAR
jgi:sialate O-acetylesterase